LRQYLSFIQSLQSNNITSYNNALLNRIPLILRILVLTVKAPIPTITTIRVDCKSCRGTFSFIAFNVRCISCYNNEMVTYYIGRYVNNVVCSILFFPSSMLKPRDCRKTLEQTGKNTEKPRWSVHIGPTIIIYFYTLVRIFVCRQCIILQYVEMIW